MNIRTRGSRPWSWNRLKTPRPRAITTGTAKGRTPAGASLTLRHYLLMLHMKLIAHRIVSFLRTFLDPCDASTDGTDPQQTNPGCYVNLQQSILRSWNLSKTFTYQSYGRCMEITLACLTRRDYCCSKVSGTGYVGPAEKTRLTFVCNISNRLQKRINSISNEYGAVFVTQRWPLYINRPCVNHVTRTPLTLGVYM